MIKPFSFCEFVNKDWNKFCLLQETHADYAFGENQSKSPVLFDESDYKFLSQFPPAVWTAALRWRYNDALQIAHDQRMKGGDQAKKIKHDEQIEDYAPELTLGDTHYNYHFGGHGKPPIWTGMRSLVKKLEAPILSHGQHTTVPGYEPGDKGIADIDINNPEEVHQYMKKYGLHDYDLTGLKKAWQHIENKPVEELNIKPPITDEKIRAKRQALMADAPHTFAGMSVMKEDAARKALKNWIQLMGLKTPSGHSVLGDVDVAKDPFTKQPLPLKRDQLPTQIRPSAGGDDTKGVYASYNHVGEDDKYGKKTEVRIPAIARKLSYTMQSRRKPEEIKEVNEDVWMPYLLPGKLLPRITLTPEQKDIIKARRQDPDIKKRGKKVKEGEDASDELWGLQNLVSNWDILTPEQKQLMHDEHRTMMHRMKYEHDPKWREENKDPYASSVNHYVGGGFTPQKGAKYTAPIYINQAEYLKLVSDHAVELREEAAVGVIKYMRNEFDYQGSADDFKFNVGQGAGRKSYRATAASTARTGVSGMMIGALPQIVDVAFALLASNLQNKSYGILDPEKGLTGRNPDISDDAAHKKRITIAYQFALETAQKALDATSLSRRQRAKGQRSATQSLSQTVGSGENAKELGTNLSNASNVDQRLAAAPDAGRQGSRVHYDVNVSSSQWLIKGIGFLEEYFKNTRNEIAEKLGETEASKVTGEAFNKMSVELVANTLYEQALDELNSGGPQTKQRAKELLQKQLQEAPYNELSPENIKEVETLIDSFEDSEVADNVDDKLDKESASHAWKTDFVDDLINKSAAEYYTSNPDLPSYDPDETPTKVFSIGPARGTDFDLSKLQPDQITPYVISLLYSQEKTGAIIGKITGHEGLGLGVQGVNKYAVPLIRKIMITKGINKSEEEIANEVASSKIILGATFKPIQLKVQAPKQPIVHANPDFVKGLADLSQWPKLAADPRLAANKQAAKLAYDELIKTIQRKIQANQPISWEENHAAQVMNAHLKAI